MIGTPGPAVTEGWTSGRIYSGEISSAPYQVDRHSPAYEPVWICPAANGHIQATGLDARGRKQYRYHPKWRELRDQDKCAHVMQFAAALPALRARASRHMKLEGLPREKVLATIVSLLEKTLIRVGMRSTPKRTSRMD